MTGATGYTLERRWDEDFDMSSVGSDSVIYAGLGTPVSTNNQMLSWADQRATYSTWRELKTRNRTWAELKKLADKEPHTSYADIAAVGAKRAAYRLKGHNERGETTYISATPVKIIPIFERDDEATISARLGERYLCKLDCTEMRRFQAGPLLNNQRVGMKIKYDPAVLGLVDFAAQTPESNTSAGTISGTTLEIHSRQNGEITFTVNRAADTEEWSSVIACLWFEALRNGQTALRLS
jgi:hypothetical protein